MANEDIAEGRLRALLLVERQIDAAHRWGYEWAVVSYVGVIALVVADAMLGRSVDLLTLFGIAVLGASGSRLARAERRAMHWLRGVYEQLDGRSPRSPRWPVKGDF